VQFLNIHISQGSVATRFGCGEIFTTVLSQILRTECASEKIYKIDQYVAKVWTKL